MKFGMKADSRWLLVDVYGSLWITRSGLRCPVRRFESASKSLPCHRDPWIEKDVLYKRVSDREKLRGGVQGDKFRILGFCPVDVISPRLHHRCAAL